MKLRKLLFSVIAVSIVTCGTIVHAQENNGAKRFEGTVTIAMTGDIMTGSIMPTPDLPPNEGRDIFVDCAELLQSVDVACGNLEGVLADRHHECLIYYPTGRTDTLYTIPRCIKRIGEKAFFKQPYLRTLEMHHEIDRLDAGALHDCPQLSRITDMPAVPPYYDSGTYMASDFNADVYKDFIKKLYSRAKHVIQAVEVDPDELVEGEFGKLIRDAVAADNLAYNKEVAKVRDENAMLNKNIASKDEEIKNKAEKVELLTNENEKKQKEIDIITKDRDRLSCELENKENERKRIEEEKQKESTAKQKAERINSLYQRRDELKKLIDHAKADILPYEKSLEKAFCNWQPKLFYTLGGISIVCIVILWILSYSSKVLSTSLNGDKNTLSLILGSVGAILFGIGHHYDSLDSINRRRELASKKWLEKEENTKYTMLQDDLTRYNDEIKSIEDELKLNNSNRKFKD